MVDHQPVNLGTVCGLAHPGMGPPWPCPKPVSGPSLTRTSIGPVNDQSESLQMFSDCQIMGWDILLLNQPFYMLIFFRKRGNIFAISIISQYWVGTGCWYPDSCMTRSSLFHLTADALVKPIARASLTHLPLVPLMCVSESGRHWFR